MHPGHAADRANEAAARTYRLLSYLAYGFSDDARRLLRENLKTTWGKICGLLLVWTAPYKAAEDLGSRHEAGPGDYPG